MEIIKRMRELGYVADPSSPELVHLQLMQMSKQAQAVPAMALFGPAGTGKTFFVESVAQALSAEIIKYQCHMGTGPEQLMIDIDLRAVVGREGDPIKPGFLVQAINLANQGKRVVLLLDELDKSRPEVDALLLDFIQSGSINDLALGELKLDGSVSIHLFITSNEERELSLPLMRRVRRVVMEYPSKNVELSILNKAGVKAELSVLLVALANKLRDMLAQGHISKAPSTPELINAGTDLMVLANMGVNPTVMEETLSSWLVTPEDKEVLYTTYPKKWIRGKLKEVFR